MKIIAVTGHRPAKIGGEWTMQGPISGRMYDYFCEYLREETPDQVISGVAVGTDLLFAMAAVHLGIPLTAAVPFEGQEAMWSQPARRDYRYVLNSGVTETRVLFPGPPGGWKYIARDKWMTEQCTQLLGVWDGSASGTGTTIGHAADLGRRISVIHPSYFIRTDDFRNRD